uniref:Methyltransferase domain-containing protein n=1 Tax=Alexandrium monilatum TaxID=311494 RepID=A0A7S4PSY1_9DINO
MPDDSDELLAWAREGKLLRLRRHAEGALKLRTGPGVFKLTAASRLAAATATALAESGLLRGSGIDWGCGSGVLALLAARSPNVDRVVGLDLEPANIQAAAENAASNGLIEKTHFHVAESFEPLDGTRLAPVDFVLANAPASPFDDGFKFRRRILKEGSKLLRPGGYVVLQMVSYYGPERIRQAVREVPGMRYLGLCSSSGWVPVDVSRQREVGCIAGGTMLTQLQDFADEERRGGLRYHCHPRGSVEPPAEGDDAEVFDPPLEEVGPEDETFSAVETLEMLSEGRIDEPLCRWQCQLFQWAPPGK